MEIRCSFCNDGLVEIDEDGTQMACGRCDRGVARVAWANVYLVTRHYGGPEEGGWWFDVGELVGSIRVDVSWDAEIVKGILRKLYADEQDGSRFSAAGGTDLSICLEDRPGENWPRERPRYE